MVYRPRTCFSHFSRMAKVVCTPSPCRPSAYQPESNSAGSFLEFPHHVVVIVLIVVTIAAEHRSIPELGKQVERIYRA
jgi:hypothetical protein